MVEPKLVLRQDTEQEQMVLVFWPWWAQPILNCGTLLALLGLCCRFGLTVSCVAGAVLLSLLQQGSVLRMRIPGFLHSLVQPVFPSAQTDGQCSWFAFRVSAAGDTGSRDLLFYYNGGVYSKEYDPSSLIPNLGQCTLEPSLVCMRIPRSPPPVPLG